MQLAFAGTPEFAAIVLQGLLDGGYRPEFVLTQPDRPSGRGRKLMPGAVKLLAEQYGLEVMQPTTLRASRASGAAALEEICGRPLDLLVVAAYGLILPARLLDHPKHGAINVHASLLPRWRGAAPVERAIMAGDTISGATLMQMDEGLDTGDILSQATCSIDSPRTGTQVAEEIARLGCDLLAAALPDLQALQRMPQTEALATYADKLSPDDARIDWHRPAKQIHDQIRAVSGRMTAWTNILDEQGNAVRLRILDSEAIDAESGGTGGQIVRADRGGLIVGCGDGALRITSLQLAAGKGRIMDAAQALNGYRAWFAVGSLLG